MHFSAPVNSEVPRKDEKCRLVYYIMTLEVPAKETFNNSESYILEPVLRVWRDKALDKTIIISNSREKIH